jgi:hypothetical protein
MEAMDALYEIQDSLIQPDRTSSPQPVEKGPAPRLASLLT